MQSGKDRTHPPVEHPTGSGLPQNALLNVPRDGEGLLVLRQQPPNDVPCLIDGWGVDADRDGFGSPADVLAGVAAPYRQPPSGRPLAVAALVDQRQTHPAGMLQGQAHEAHGRDLVAPSSTLHSPVVQFDSERPAQTVGQLVRPTALHFTPLSPGPNEGFGFGSRLRGDGFSHLLRRVHDTSYERSEALLNCRGRYLSPSREIPSGSSAAPAALRTLMRD
ncbi:hypothetical protein [Streptomyces sp. NPDC088775]|uniref:hypothetical protein n=1 Tax=Streptomyces sp. NPDC088775 TaxID=3365896 RepID=UPI0038071053